MAKQMKRLAGTLASLGVAATLVHPVSTHQDNETDNTSLNEGHKSLELVKDTAKTKTSIDNKDVD